MSSRWRSLARELRARLVLPDAAAPALLWGPLPLALALRRALPGLVWAVAGPLSRRRRARAAAAIPARLRAALGSLPLPAERCTAVVAYGRLASASAAALVAEAARVLRPGGMLLHAQPAAPPWLTFARRLGLPVAPALAPEDWTALLLHAGLEGIEQRWPQGPRGLLLTSGRLRPCVALLRPSAPPARVAPT